MTSYEEALKIIIENTHSVDVHEIPLFDSIGYVLAEDVCAAGNIPQTNRASPDGYAVRSADLKGASPDRPVGLRIIGTARAGFVPKKTVTVGTAMRIMTGSVVPTGADCVVRFEDTDEPKDKNGPNPADPKTVEIFGAQEPGSNIGKAGFSARVGSLVVPKGTLIGPPQLSALTTVGKESVKVVRRPVVAIMATGDELVPLGKPLSPAQVYNSNAEAVAAAVIRFGGIPRILNIAGDSEKSFAAKLTKGLTLADAVITTGGVSKGDYDIVRMSLGKLGQLLFARISMGPGASVSFALANVQSLSGAPLQKPVFALAGPPSGALINCETLVRPGLFKMRGIADVRHPTVQAEAVDSVARKVPKGFVRWTRLMRTGRGFQVLLNPPEGIGPLASMASANSLTIIKEGATIRPGDLVDVMPLDWAGY
jgi:molybdopterin molybdotransferase